VIQTSYKESDSKDQSTVEFKSVVTEHALPEKKPAKDAISTEGVLKYNWPTKHFELVPSVLLFTVAFSVDWTLSEWVRKEAWIQDRYNRLKTLTGSRDVKIIVLVIKVGMGVTDKESMDERMNSLKRHLQLDSRTFHLITSHDISSNSANMKKVSKYAKEYSSQYYINKIKTLKTAEKAIAEKYKGLEEALLQARFNFKIAFFYEFQTQPLQSLRYYRQCYTSLSACVDLATEDLLEQVKAVAEIVHVKICHTLLLTNSIGDAFLQFKAHIKRFVTVPSAQLWRHYAWVADQYVVFAELMQQFSISDALADADRGYYYQNAARYSQKRQASFERIRQALAGKTDASRARRGSGADSGHLRSSFRGMIILAPKFLGSAVQFEEPLMDSLQMDLPSRSTYSEYLQEQELGVAHNALIMNLLTLALEKTNYAFVRRRGMLQYLIAEEHMKERCYPKALECLTAAAELLCEEGWTVPSATILNAISQCAILLGRPLAYLDAALKLYSTAAQDVLSRHEVEALHLNIFSLLDASLTSPALEATVRPSLPDSAFSLRKFPVRSRASFLTTSSTPLINHPEYGRAATATSAAGDAASPAVEYCLGLDHVIDMSSDRRMFDVRVAFDEKTVELGQSVLVTLTLRSRFVDEVVFDELKVYFTDNVVVKSLLGVDKMPADAQRKLSPRNSPVKQLGKSGSAESLNERDTSNEEVLVSNADIIYTSLVFPPKKDVSFSFYVYISEPCFSKFTAPDAILCLERVEMCWYSNKRLSELKLPSPTPAGDDETPTRNSAVTLNVSAFPLSVLRAQQELTLAAGKPHTMKDIVGFCADDRFGAVTVRKPNALISLLEPTLNVNLLQSVVQRINVFLKIGQSDVLDGYIYLSSDHIPQHAGDALFWYPDKKQMQNCSSTSSDDALDKVPLHPMQLSVTMQPVQPIRIPAPVFTGASMEAVICVPLFVKCDVAKNVSITLRVEFVPKGILRSSLTKDFTISTSFLCPFDVRYAMGRDGTLQDLEVATLNARAPALLSTSLICLNSLQHAIGVVGVELTTGEAGKSNVGIVADGEICSKAVLLQAKTPLPLRSQELVTKTVHIQHTPTLPTPPARALGPYAAMLAAQKKDAVTAAAQPTSLSTGRVEVTWRVLQAHILRRPHIPLTSAGLDSPSKASPRAGDGVGLTLSADGSAGEWSWLHSLGRDREGQVEVEPVDEVRYLDTKFSVTPVAKLIYPVPEIKVQKLSFCD
jgi:hypothetical protein